MRYFKLLCVAVSAVMAIFAFAATIANAENLWNDEAHTVATPVKEKMTATNKGEPTLKASILTVKCKTASATLEVTENNTTTKKFAASLTALSFSSCTDQVGNAVVVTTNKLPWTVKELGSKKIELTGINATIEDSKLGQACVAENKAGSKFEATVTNGVGVGSEVTATKQPLALKAVTGKTCSASSGEETATFVTEKAGTGTSYLALA